MTRSHNNIKALAWLMHRQGIENIVVSPGSRNAPAIILFSASGFFRLHSIVDERSAGFFALGMALYLQKPVALLCTSGTAVLNYAPALAEAYYQKVPLLAITADRPEEWIGQGDGQTIRQAGVFANYVRKSFHLTEAASEKPRYLHRLINEAIARTQYPVPGPVHINLPVSEPLYDFDLQLVSDESETMVYAPVAGRLPAGFINEWNSCSRKMILAGQMPPDETVQACLRKLATDPSVIIFTETTTNVHDLRFISCIDRVIEGIGTQHYTTFKPDILVTIGGAVVSKKIKTLLRKMKPSRHWHISPDPDEFFADTYLSLTHTLPLDGRDFLEQLTAQSVNPDSDYAGTWQTRNIFRQQQHVKFSEQVQFTDFWVYHSLFQHIPVQHAIHLGNSTPVRYAQLFDHIPYRNFFANRGTSGIDGGVSTAAGFAAVADTPVTVITGDIGFLYDSNALWNAKLPSGITIILINNQGGNIFRILDGPDRFAELEEFIETRHSLDASRICQTFGVEYHHADSKETLAQGLKAIYRPGRGVPALLEVFTPSLLSASTLKDYFKTLLNDQ